MGECNKYVRSEEITVFEKERLTGNNCRVEWEIENEV